MKQTIKATQIRSSFAEIINRVVYGGEEFIVERQGIPVVFITKVPKVEKQNNKVSPHTFLSNLNKYVLKDAPKDLAKNHDKYIWER